MANNTDRNHFKDDEISIMTYRDKKEEKWMKNIFPDKKFSITTEIIRYDENIAVVGDGTTTMKRHLPGTCMASIERDYSIAQAILELSVTRVIARSLRFAGYGIEYCSAEEVSHLENGNGNIHQPDQVSEEFG